MKMHVRYAALFLLSILFMRCDEDTEKQFSYILVTVHLNSVVYEGEMGSNTRVGENVRMLIVTEEGEHLNEIGVTDATGITSGQATFKLYKDQPIEACVSLAELPDNYNCETITWQVADAGAVESDGELKFTWDATLALVYPL